jgi:serine/threonine protein kinase
VQEDLANLGIQRKKLNISPKIAPAIIRPPSCITEEQTDARADKMPTKEHEVRSDRHDKAPELAEPVAQAPQPRQKRASKAAGSQEDVIKSIQAVCTAGSPFKKYQKKKHIGQGASGEVFVAVDKATGQVVAIKEMDMAIQPKKETIINEILVLKGKRCP